MKGAWTSVGIATRYGLNGPGIESRCRRDFGAPVQTSPGAHLASCKMGTGFLSRGYSGLAKYHPPPSTIEVKERVQLQLDPFSGPTRCIRENLPNIYLYPQIQNYNYAQQQQTTNDFLYTHLPADCVLLRHEVTLPRYINTPLLTNRQGY